jgi:eukaryotic-like serine/threonine-protein kinase
LFRIREWRGVLPIGNWLNTVYLEPVTTELLGRTIEGAGEIPDANPFGRVDSLVGPTVAHHHIITCIGHGNSADVWRARHLLLNQEVALKVLTLTPFDRYEERRTNFVHEAVLARSLNHRALMPVFDVGLTAVGAPYLSMAVGRSTFDKPTGLFDCIDAIESVARALDYLHRNDVIHCDVKPSNVVLVGSGRDRRWVLADMGLAWTSDWPVAIGSGSFGYTAPERFTRTMPTVASDIYAFGKLIAATLLPQLIGNAAERVAGLVSHITAADPTLRPSSADEVVQEVLLVLRST